jgi:hypothetical protein
MSGLPSLPENFAYTHIARLGDLIIASWEEQQDYNIGAAGFMVIREKPKGCLYPKMRKLEKHRRKQDRFESIRY